NGNGNGNGGGGGGGGGGGTTPTPAPTTGTGSLTFSAFTPPGIPAGATVTGATLRLTYGTSSQATSRSLDVTTSAGTATIPIANVSARSPGATETVTLTAAQAAGLVTTGTGGGSVTYTSTMTATGSEVIDAVALDLTYTVPVRGENATSTCINRAYTTAGACAVLSTATSYAGRLFVQGTTYAPAAAVDLTLSNITAQVLRFGVVSRVLSIKETGAITYSGPVIELPDDSPGYGPGGTIVYLTVFVCPGSSTCSATGEPALRARVYINDPSGTPSPPSRQMIVQSWAIEN
ncbi:MAG TPA: hypothetical protein VE463_06955, partial [Blastococcus sp.]|nr:hypothetical protein [Blastococcus sp.]